MFICQIRLLGGRYPAGEELNEADEEAKVERSGFCWRRGWFGRRGARCAESCESLFGELGKFVWSGPPEPPQLLTWRHFLAMIWDRAFILHTLFVL